MKKILLTMAMALITALAFAQTKDEHGIIIAPPADAKYEIYTRVDGMMFYPAEDGVYEFEQEGTIEVAFCPDGTVYIKDIICDGGTEAWVKGTVNEEQICVIEQGQPVYWDDEYQTTCSLYRGYYSEAGGEEADPFIIDVTKPIEIGFYIVDGYRYYTLLDTDEDHYIGYFWDDDKSWSGYGDYGTVITNDPNAGGGNVAQADVKIEGNTVTAVNPLVTPNGESVTKVMADLGLANEAELTEYEFTDGWTIAFDQEEGQNPPKYYTSGAAARIYRDNSIYIVAAKPIASVVITCTGSDRCGNTDAEAMFSENEFLYINSTSLAEEGKGGVQLRIVSITINYGTVEGDGISNIISETSTPTAFYDMSGRRTNGIQKGMNIVKLSNGKTIKVMQK